MSSSEKNSSETKATRQFKKSPKNLQLLRKRHEQLEKENMEIANELKEIDEKVKEATSENDKTETISESSGGDSFDSNDELRVVEDRRKG
jgi:hypothetical protein